MDESSKLMKGNNLANLEDHHQHHHHQASHSSTSFIVDHELQQSTSMSNHSSAIMLNLTQSEKLQMEREQQKQPLDMIEMEKVPIGIEHVCREPTPELITNEDMIVRDLLEHDAEEERSRKEKNSLDDELEILEQDVKKVQMALIQEKINIKKKELFAQAKNIPSSQVKEVKKSRKRVSSNNHLSKGGGDNNTHVLNSEDPVEQSNIQSPDSNNDMNSSPSSPIAANSSILSPTISQTTIAATTKLITDNTQQQDDIHSNSSNDSNNPPTISYSPASPICSPRYTPASPSYTPASPSPVTTQLTNNCSPPHSINDPQEAAPQTTKNLSQSTGNIEGVGGGESLGRNRRVRQKNRYFEDFHCIDLVKGHRSKDDYDAYSTSTNTIGGGGGGGGVAGGASRSSSRRYTTDSNRSGPSADDNMEPDKYFTQKYCRKCSTRTPHDFDNACQACLYNQIVMSSKRQKSGSQRSRSSRASQQQKTQQEKSLNNNNTESVTQTSTSAPSTPSAVSTKSNSRSGGSGSKRKAGKQTGAPNKIANNNIDIASMQSNGLPTIKEDVSDITTGVNAARVPDTIKTISTPLVEAVSDTCKSHINENTVSNTVTKDLANTATIPTATATAVPPTKLTATIRIDGNGQGRKWVVKPGRSADSEKVTNNASFEPDYSEFTRMGCYVSDNPPSSSSSSSSSSSASSASSSFISSSTCSSSLSSLPSSPSSPSSMQTGPMDEINHSNANNNSNNNNNNNSNNIDNHTSTKDNNSKIENACDTEANNNNVHPKSAGNNNKTNSNNNSSCSSSNNNNNNDNQRNELGITKLDTWSPNQVAQYMSSKGFVEEAESFRAQLVDGISLLLMQKNDFTIGLKMKLGPALKIYNHVCKLKSDYFREYATAS